VVDRGSIYWTSELGAWSIRGAIRKKWISLGWEEGVLGYPVTDQLATPDGIGQYNLFTKLRGRKVEYHGSIYWTKQLGAHPVYGDIFTLWTSLGREGGRLGYPVADPHSLRVGNQTLTFQHFQHGTIYDDGGGATASS
jgi:uncharacterized protein with LGFP repeats